MHLLQKAAVPMPMILERLGPTHISVATDHASGPHETLKANTYTHWGATTESTSEMEPMRKGTHNECDSDLAIDLGGHGRCYRGPTGDSSDDEHGDDLDEGAPQYQLLAVDALDNQEPSNNTKHFNNIDLPGILSVS